MFRGTHELTINGKGRLAVPAKFRDVLARRFGGGALVVTLDSRDRLLLYPECEWETVERQLLSLNTKGKPHLQLYQNLLLHNAETLELDGAGRILLPPNLRRLTGFDKDVVLVARVNRLELWDRARKAAETERALALNPADLDAELADTDLQL